jgi:hypothetical protein
MDSKVQPPAKRLPPNAGKGRVKGVPNKVTGKVRQAIQAVLEANADQLRGWFKRLGDKDPGRALAVYSQLGEFVTPKLGRLEHTGENGDPIVVKVDRSDGD